MSKVLSEWSDIVLTVVVPAYNEAPTVERAIQRLRNVPLRLEVIAVNDGSTDQTGAILDTLARAGLVQRVIHLPENRGKGAALRAALSAATGHVIVVQDADLEYDPQDLPRLVDPVRLGKADAVYGSRFRSDLRERRRFWHSVANRLLTRLSNTFTALTLTDMETGYKVVRADLLKALPLTSNRFGVEVELTTRLAQAGARVWEIPITYAGRTYAQGKKFGWGDGLAALWHILRFSLFRPRSPHR